MEYTVTISYANEGPSLKMALEYYNFLIEGNIDKDEIFFDQKHTEKIGASSMETFYKYFDDSKIDIVFFSKEYVRSDNCLKEFHRLKSKYLNLNNNGQNLNKRFWIIHCDNENIFTNYPSLNFINVPDKPNHKIYKQQVLSAILELIPASSSFIEKWTKTLDSVKYEFTLGDSMKYKNLIDNIDIDILLAIKETNTYHEIHKIFSESNLLLINGAVEFGKSIYLKLLKNEFNLPEDNFHTINSIQLDEPIDSFDDFAYVIYYSLVNSYREIFFEIKHPNQVKSRLLCNNNFHNKIDKLLKLLNEELSPQSEPLTFIINLDNIETFCGINLYDELDKYLILKERHENISTTGFVNLIFLSRFWPTKISSSKYLINIPLFDYNLCAAIFERLFELEAINNYDKLNISKFIHEATNGVLWLIMKLYSAYIFERLSNNSSSPFQILNTIMSDSSKLLFHNRQLLEPIKKMRDYIYLKDLPEKDVLKILKLHNNLSQPEIDDLSKINIIKFLGLIIPSHMKEYTKYDQINLPYLVLIHREKIIELTKK
jgi:hypothetical protein